MKCEWCKKELNSNNFVERAYLSDLVPDKVFHSAKCIREFIESTVIAKWIRKDLRNDRSTESTKEK